MKHILTPYRLVMLGVMGILILLGFWIAPEMGLLAIAGVMLFILLYSFYWLAVLRRQGATFF